MTQNRNEPIAATLLPDEAARRAWFAVVVGAGVAGGALAGALAADGRAVLLVDKASFPRAKTCGGTLNPRALASIERLGLGEALAALRPNRIRGVDWRQPSGGRGTVDFEPDARALAVSREALDAALVREAIGRGAHFLPEVRCLSSCLAGDGRVVCVRTPAHDEIELHAEVVLACDGLGSVLAAGAGLAIPARATGRHYIGASVVTAAGDVAGAPGDRILMALGKRGYAGAVRVERGRWNIAAAIRLAALREAPGPDAVARELLASVGVSLREAPTGGERWSVTPPRLERRVTRPCAERLLLVGDAAGYAEPITGEGMAWALGAAESVRDLLRGGWNGDTAAAWERDWRRTIRDRQLLVRLAGRAARSSLATNAVLAGLRLAPGLGRWLARSLTTESPGAGAAP